MRANHSPFKKEVRHKLLADEIDAAIVQAHHLQVSQEEFLAIVRKRFDLFEQKQKANETKATLT